MQHAAACRHGVVACGKVQLGAFGSGVERLGQRGEGLAYGAVAACCAAFGDEDVGALTRSGILYGAGDAEGDVVARGEVAAISLVYGAARLYVEVAHVCVVELVFVGRVIGPEVESDERFLRLYARYILGAVHDRAEHAGHLRLAGQ